MLRCTDALKYIAIMFALTVSEC